MIQNWDIISRIDPQTKSLLYALVTDGTEHDARLIAKKLAGYAQAPTAAVAPFVYQFELPSDMDESTLEKIRTAVSEGVAQTNKVNQFVPGGVLGEPLFNQDVTKDDKDFPTFFTLYPSESFFRPAAEADAAPAGAGANRASIDLEDSGIGLQKRTLETGPIETPPSPPQEKEQFLTSPEAADPWPAQAPARQLPEEEPLLRKDAPSPEALAPAEEPETGNPINDKDMLIKDMEGTLLDQMPLDDIFEAKTKYDMFLDVGNPAAGNQAAEGRRAKLNDLADGKDSLEETFNVFEQKIKDETCFVDVEDVSQITDRIPKKKLDISLTNIPSAQTAEDKIPPGAPQTADVSPAQEPAESRVREQNAAEQTSAPNAEKAALEAAVAKLLDEHNAPKTDENGNIQIPEEVEIMNTIPPVPGVQVRHFDATEHAPQDGSDLPEITIRERVDALEKTFNLETTMNTEVVRRTFQKTLHTQQPVTQQPSAPQMPEEPAQSSARQTQPVQPAPRRPQEPPAKTPVRPLQDRPEAAPAPSPAPQEPKNMQEIPASPRRTFRIKLKKPLEQKPADTPHLDLQNDYKAEPSMQENNEEKTTFRIRRKDAPAQPQAPVQPARPVQQPQAPAVPAQPIRPAQPAPAQPRPQQPAAQRPAPQPQQPAARPGMSLGPNSSGAHIEKTKTIDHSIELPLSELKKHNWPLEVPLVPTYTLENMVISVNRFAHATTISVIDSPGRLYNPLVLFGPTGTGKTHFLNAIGYAMSQKLGQENIFMTNGVRLSRGIQRYVMEGNIDKFEKFMDSVKVILIDDLHLVAVNEQNRVHISNLLNKFMREQKQIVITSKYPPESLAKLEELINFKLDSGWISELKSAQGAAHFKIVKKMLVDNGVDLTDNQVEAFFGEPNMTLSTVSRSIRRIKVLEQVIFPGLENVDRSQAMILEKLLATKGEDKTSAILKRDVDEITSLPPFGKGEWGRIGFFYPQNNYNMMNWMVYALSERAKELGVEGSFEIAVRSSYATENIISSAFKIANLCDNKKLKGAVILGPSLQVCDPSVRENFYDILTHMLEVMLIRCGLINMEDEKLPRPYVKLISALLR